ncbi:XRE family transcriptional regulator [Mesorhizobium sp. M0563]|uniref:XRE family transcriptional regulator n=1 Tax=Mesorhizobium sp. M0563 TaxID=2956959 RepID=UPI0033385474
MASPKSKSGVRTGPGRQARTAAKSTLKAAFLARVGKRLPKGVSGSTLTVSDQVSKIIKVNPERVTALLELYGEAVFRSRTGARVVSFRVDVDPEGATTVTPVEEVIPTQARVPEQVGIASPELQDALAAARARGRLRAAEILTADDMLSAEAFAELLGTTRVTVNTKRQSGQLLGLDGAKRGFRFPVWQLDADGRPYAELAALHERLGGAWAVYRFLVQPHGELEGLTGRDALERGKTKAALEVAKSVGRDFR